MSRKEIINNIYNIFKEENRFLTLKEIYLLYQSKYDISKFSDYEALIRRNMNSVCLDRDLREKDKEPLFFSLSPKRTRGNQFGLVEWNINFVSNDIDNITLDNILNKMPEEPIFDVVDVEEVFDNNIVSQVQVYSRRAVYVAQALYNANYLCEYDNKHKTFIRKSNCKNYTEAHHLIPLCYQKDFKYNLDVPANIISLCSTCHNMIHYGKDVRDILWHLYSLRIEELKKYKIDCSFEQLCRYYNI